MQRISRWRQQVVQELKQSECPRDRCGSGSCGGQGLERELACGGGLSWAPPLPTTEAARKRQGLKWGSVHVADALQTMYLYSGCKLKCMLTLTLTLTADVPSPPKLFDASGTIEAAYSLQPW